MRTLIDLERLQTEQKWYGHSTFFLDTEQKLLCSRRSGNVPWPWAGSSCKTISLAVEQDHLTVRSGCFAEFLRQLREAEKAGSIAPDPDVDAYLGAIAVEGARHNPVTHYILRVLGLEVCHL